MGRAEQLITEHLELWSSAVKARSSAGRGSSKKSEIYGVSKLRELVLDLAIHGLLTKTNPNDEPIAQLLECINTERLRFEKEGIIRSKKPLPSIKEDEKLFELPEHWEWLRLREIGHDWGQMKPETDFTYIDVGAINKERGTISDPQVLPAIDAPSRARKVIKEGTVIYSTVRPYLLNIAVVDKYPEPPPIASTAFAIIHPFKGVLAQYIYHYLRSPTFTSYVEACQTGTSYPAINDKQFFSGLIPIPPLGEQHRIVAKVDELMALCDQLEEEQENNLETHETLVSTLLDALASAAADGSQFADAWQRIKDNFDILFTTESSVDQLKQAILQLAVRGKLVPQDPEDEPATALLNRVAVAKDRLAKEKKIKKQKSPKTTFANTENSSSIPKSWNWVRLQEIYYTISPSHKKLKSSEIKDSGKYPVIDQGQEFIAGFSDDDALVIKVPGPLVVFGDHTQNIKYIDFDFIPGADGTKILCPIDIYPRYFYRYLLSYNLRKKGYARHFKLLNENLIAIPPLAEQHRIVAKVDELFTLCGHLKTRLYEAQETQINLADSILEQAIHSPA